ncbi:MAG: hypothetical protein GY727_08705, partial [Gammaproteobacteria bacterium]|nr:hypothetical protein [Gammaproteobacteria bacterium]
DSLADLAGTLEVTHYSTGDELIQAGEASSRIFLLLDGLLISDRPGNNRSGPQN